MRLLNTDKDESVRLAACWTSPSGGESRVILDFHESLYRLTKPSEEPDASVRRRAWEVFQELLPTAPDAQLQFYADQFRKQG